VPGVSTSTVYIDCAKFVPHIPKENSAKSVAVALALTCGIVAYPVNYNGHYYVRMYVPPRVYTRN